MSCAGHPHAEDAEHRPPRQGRRAVREHVLHDVALLAEPGVDPHRPLRAHGHGVRDNFTELPTDARPLADAAARAGLRDGLHRQVAHGRGQRRAAARLRLLRHAQGAGQILRHRVEHQRRGLEAHQGLLHHDRHRHGARLAEAATTAASRGRCASATRRRTASTRPRTSTPTPSTRCACRIRTPRFISTTSRRGSSSGSTPGTASTARSSSGAKSSPTTGPRR